MVDTKDGPINSNIKKNEKEIKEDTKEEEESIVEETTSKDAILEQAKVKPSEEDTAHKVPKESLVEKAQTQYKQGILYYPVYFLLSRPS